MAESNIGFVQEEGTCVSVLVGHSGAVNSVAVDRFGKIAVTAGADGTGRVWNVATGTCIQLLLGHTSLGDASAPFCSSMQWVWVCFRNEIPVLGEAYQSAVAW